MSNCYRQSITVNGVDGNILACMSRDITREQ